MLIGMSKFFQTQKFFLLVQKSKITLVKMQKIEEKIHGATV